MSVRPILLQKDGAIRGVPGIYRTSPPPIVGSYAGSDLLEDVTYYTVNSSGEADLKTVKAYPFYVDSISGGADTSGDGTIANPWRSVNHALSTLQPILACLSSKSCCTCLILRVAGTVDYTVQYNNGSAFNGYNRFIIEPWNADNIIFYSANQNTCLNNLKYSIFKNIEANIVDDSYTYLHNILLIDGCSFSVFNSCRTNVNMTSVSACGTVGFCNNVFSVFYKCDGLHHIRGDHSGTTIFEYNMNSLFFESGGICYGYNTSNDNDDWLVTLYVFHDNPYSVMNQCSGYVYSENKRLQGCGFFYNISSTFQNCTGNSLNLTNCDI